MFGDIPNLKEEDLGMLLFSHVDPEELMTPLANHT